VETRPKKRGGTNVQVVPWTVKKTGKMGKFNKTHTFSRERGGRRGNKRKQGMLVVGGTNGGETKGAGRHLIPGKKRVGERTGDRGC